MLLEAVPPGVEGLDIDATCEFKNEDGSKV
jgi:hypothetical protein